MAPLTRTFGLWARACCHRCGEEFQVTRTRELTVPINKPLECDNCELYGLGYAEGKDSADEGLKAENAKLRELLREYHLSYVNSHGYCKKCLADHPGCPATDTVCKPGCETAAALGES